MDRGALQVRVVRVTNSWTRLKRPRTHAHKVAKYTKNTLNSVKPDLLTDDSEVTERSKATELEITEG